MTRSHLLILLSLTLITRLSTSWFVNDFQPQVWEYETLAVNMMEKGEYVFSYRDYGDYKAVVAPGYSFLTFAVYSINRKTAFKNTSRDWPE